MALVNVKYKVRFTESERGWGQKSWYNEYDTREEAQKAISECNAGNNLDYVPNYYIVADNTITIVES